MFKLFLVLALIAAVAAKPTATEEPTKRSLEATIYSVAPLALHEPTLLKVGEHVASYPTAVSHQSSTIVHDRANVVTPIVAPTLRTSYSPLISSYSPLLGSYYGAYPSAAAAYNYPLNGYYYGAPYTLDGYNRQQLYKSLL